MALAAADIVESFMYVWAIAFKHHFFSAEPATAVLPRPPQTIPGARCRSPWPHVDVAHLHRHCTRAHILCQGFGYKQVGAVNGYITTTVYGVSDGGLNSRTGFQ